MDTVPLERAAKDAKEGHISEHRAKEHRKQADKELKRKVKEFAKWDEKRAKDLAKRWA